MPDTSTITFGCDAVNEHISKPIPETLWHYTDFAALQGILNSKKIWATEYRFLNDHEEFIHAKKLAQELADEEPEYTGILFPAREFLQKGVSRAFGAAPLHEGSLRIMMASFSEVGDQLSQWRGYARNSTGVSLGLDVRSLRPLAEFGMMVTFAPCVYSEDAKRGLLRAVFVDYRNALQSWWDSVIGVALQKGHHLGSIPHESAQRIVAAYSKELEKVVKVCEKNLRFDLMRVSNESFSEEKEWRLVLPSETTKMPTNFPIEFRPVRDALVPYIAYPLLLPKQEGQIKCNGVFLGPGSHPSAEVGVNMFLQSLPIPIQAKQSKIPYRPG